MPLPPSLVLRTARVTGLKRLTPELFVLSCSLADGADFSYQAGQWVYLHLLNEQGESIARGAFSLASSPSEPGKELVFGVKIYGRLTASLAELAVGEQIGVQGPFGVFTLPKEAHPLLFVAGGIGITPLRSMIRQALDASWLSPMALIWVSKTEPELIYHREFIEWAKQSGGKFIYLPSLTQEEGSAWTGMRGRLNPLMLEALELPWQSIHAYLCGPNPFMEDAKRLLQERGVSGKPRLHEERFT